MTKERNLTPVVITFIIVIVELAICLNSVLLPNLKADLAISDHLAQVTISAGLFILGCSGVIYGGLADSMGRRPMLIFSVAVFFLSTLVITWTSSVNAFLVAKLFQGVGSGAAWVVGNACLKDIYSGEAYTQVMNYVHAIAGIIPAVAPVIGSYLGVLIGWRACFQILCLCSLVALGVIVFFQKETLQNKKKFCLRTFLTNYRVVFHEKLFIKYLVVKVLCVMLILIEASNIPLLFVDYMEVVPEYYGLYALPTFMVYVLGAVISTKIAVRYKTESIIFLGLIFIAASNLLVTAISLFALPTPILIQICKIPCYAGWGFIFGNATAMIVSSVPGKAGITSAIMIALEMLFSSAGIFVLGFAFDGTILPVTYCHIIVSCICMLSMYLMGRDVVNPS